MRYPAPWPSTLRTPKFSRTSSRGSNLVLAQYSFSSRGMGESRPISSTPVFPSSFLSSLLTHTSTPPSAIKPSGRGQVVTNVSSRSHMHMKDSGAAYNHRPNTLEVRMNMKLLQRLLQPPLYLVSHFSLPTQPRRLLSTFLKMTSRVSQLLH